MRGKLDGAVFESGIGALALSQYPNLVIMIKELHLNNWKSFQSAKLFIDPLTVLIGLNASGKSNALDALQFLQRSVVCRDLHTALAGDQYLTEIRGGLEWIPQRGKDQFTIGVIIGTDNPDVDLDYRITIGIKKTANALEVNSINESLNWVNRDGETQSHFDTTTGVFGEMTGFVYDSKGDSIPFLQVSRNTSVLYQFRYQRFTPDGKAEAAIIQVATALQRIFILDPIPQKARDFSKIAFQLNPDGSNLAGVIASMQPEKKAAIEEKLSRYAHQLPEREIEKVWVEPVGRSKTDAMLYCEEQFFRNKTVTVDIRGLSDGTIRFLTILTAVLTREKGSLLVIEEIDNGIHPSRAKLLLEILLKEGKSQGVDLLVTSHNPAFLDQLVPNLLPFVMLVHRDSENGTSIITPLEQAEKLHFLMGKGSLGAIATNEKWYEQLLEN